MSPLKLDSKLIPQRLARLEHRRDPLLCLTFAAKRDKSLAFEIEQITLGHERLVIHVPAAHHAGKLFAD